MSGVGNTNNVYIYMHNINIWACEYILIYNICRDKEVFRIRHVIRYQSCT